MNYTELQRQAFQREMAGDYTGSLASYRKAWAIGESAWGASPNNASVEIGCMDGLQTKIRRLSRRQAVQS